MRGGVLTNELTIHGLIGSGLEKGVLSVAASPPPPNCIPGASLTEARKGIETLSHRFVQFGCVCV